MKLELLNKIDIGLAWCLFCNDAGDDTSAMQRMRQQLQAQKEVPTEILPYLEQVQVLQNLPFPQTVEELKKYQQDYPQLWNSQIGLVYGGVTKVKQYVFEQTKLPDIRGASALLDRINLVDLPAFFGKYESQWLKNNFPSVEIALIPQLLIYSTGGKLLAFCPAKFIDDLANAIERRYTQETLTANSCAVGAKFKLIEMRFGLLPDQINENTFWLEKYRQNQNNEIIQVYFAQPDIADIDKQFEARKSFNETVTKLTSLFNQRRSGNITADNRPTRLYPAIFETHPYLVRDTSDNASAVMRVGELPGEPNFSESLARKRLVGNIAKRSNISNNWYYYRKFTWQPGEKIYIESWVEKFENYLKENQLENLYYGDLPKSEVTEARSLIEIGNSSQPKGFVAYIYADGNNMGGYIQKIKSPEEYQNFSNDVSEATEKSVYKALFQHLHPHKLGNIPDKEKEKRNDKWIHPFEIITIGGDDVFLIVPADKALAITKTICEEFEEILKTKSNESTTDKPKNPYITDETYNSQFVHRYHPPQTENQLEAKNKLDNRSQCRLSMSAGVLIAAEDTPIYYAEKLTSQLMKSAKKYAKELKEKKYYGGTIDFLVMKAVTMISSNVGEFRTQGLIKAGPGEQKLKLYGAPYTLDEIGGILETAKALKEADFPRSQLYQIRSLLERGKQTAILNYRYFRVRLSDKKAQKLLKTLFDEAWCKPKDPKNNGNLAPWMSLKENSKNNDKSKTTYETIWRELVDLYPFIPKTPNPELLPTNKEESHENTQA
ncbi:MAG: type III-B CRISPR-associated protein Cas10/Cmr2 [Desmonostoc vinosum HA7617-LM4]|jgi:CRISPR-associated protein Cmr2|nr:type III-B CRISPR-associated protein Cas10/Cmr2 [Desmonostoc vinosum HA7617-LM4]